MPGPIHNFLSPNIGIESITRHSDAAPLRLPTSLDVVPSGENASVQSVENMYAPRLEARVQAFLTPSIASRELLIPGVFNSRLKKAADELRTLGRKNKSHTLRRAADMLEEDAELKDLLTTYRQLLQKG